MAINKCDIFKLTIFWEFYGNDHVLLLVKLPGTNDH